MDMPSLATAMASLKLAKDAVSAALAVKTFNEVAPALAGVNDQLLKAQESLFVYSARLADMQDKLAHCQDELRELKRVQSERDQYTLFELSNGQWVYKSDPSPEAIEDGSRSVEAVHYLCQGCFDQGKKFVLQRSVEHGTVFLRCHGCGKGYATGETEPVRDLTLKQSW